jgi:hypothetical protein
MPTHTKLRGRWLLIARVTWVFIAALTVGFAVIGFGFAILHPEQSTTDVIVRAWTQAGVPLLIPVFGLLVPLLVTSSSTAFIVFWHRSDEWMPMLVSLSLLTVGAMQLVLSFERGFPAVPGPGRRRARKPSRQLRRFSRM